MCVWASVRVGVHAVCVCVEELVGERACVSAQIKNESFSFKK